MTKTVASLCPWPVQIHRPHFTLRNIFALPAVQKGQPPAMTDIEDNIQWERILSVSPSTSRTILGEEIADDFVLHVAKNGPFMTEDARPAVWVCEGPQPSAEESAAELEKLKRYCGLMVEYADDLDRRRAAGEPAVPKITDRMKDCCRFLDLRREWLTSLVNSSTTCIYCTKTIPVHAIKCPECNEVVNRAKYDELKKNGGKIPEPVSAQ
jgi:hypothetical protein